jgi:hypothetical protein
MSFEGEPPPPAPSPPPVGQPEGSRPRRRWVVPAAVGAGIAVIAGVVAWGLAGNDDGDGEGGGQIDDDVSAAPPAPSSTIELDDLEPALLTEDEVGEGFTEDTRGGGEVTSDELDTSAECREAFGMVDDVDAQAEADFVGEADAIVAHTLTLVVEGQPSLSRMRDVLNQCEIGWADEQVEGGLALSVDEIDGVGDEAVEIEIVYEIASEGVEITADGYGILSRRDGVQSAVFGVGPTGGTESEPADRDLIRALAQRADEKLSDVLEG